ncbi:ABC transporter permease [Aureivirga sp. CE67]|uniref:ABC transporter permease n=1 Tax=Aureivirga sp. CE67 TaxID=1788983 RepID=UPI0018CAE779|nr:ABC transporter permease [Aureivirga sp. CE67]
MLLKLQKKTLIKSQIIGYAFTLFVGISILLLISQLYFDLKPLLNQESDVFKNQSAIISKRISLLKTLNKDKIYFTEEEILDLKNQDFIEDVSKFKNADFKVQAFTSDSGGFPMFRTDLFFESIPDKYLDVDSEEWKWEESEDFIPIIIPENYLNLYNFGFAESQGLPVLSKNTISNVEFNLQISNRFKSKNYKSKIVGFSNKINSILVPDAFLTWANKEFGNSSKKERTSRVFIEFNKPSDEGVLKFFNENNYTIGKDKLEFSKLLFFFKTALFFVFAVAIIIIILSIAFIFLSLNLIIQKNKEMILNLFSIGYDYKQIAKFYQLTISLTTTISLFLAAVTTFFIRGLYLDKISSLLDFDKQGNILFSFMFIILVILLLIYNWMILKKIRRVCEKGR